MTSWNRKEVGRRIQRLKERYREQGLFLFVGGVVFAVGTGILLLTVEVLDFIPEIGYLVELVITFQLSYILNSRLTFVAAGATNNRLYMIRGLKYNAVRGVIVIGEWLVMTFIYGLGFHYLGANLVVVFFGTVVSYLAVKRWVYTVK